MAGITSRTTAQKLEIFRSLFTGLGTVYGTYDLATGQVRQVKEPVTTQVLLAHLRGNQPYGVYLLDADRTRAVAADFDEPDSLPPLEIVQAARHFAIEAHIERSKSKGFHVWVFFPEQGVAASKARLVMRLLLAEIGKPQTEIFPKHDALTPAVPFGNFINAPLFGRLVPQGRTVFVRPEDSLRPHPNQWDLLERVERVPESTLDDIIAINSLRLQENTPAASPTPSTPHSLTSHSLPPCAQRILAEGVTANQRVVCFRLAVHLKLLGMPEDIATATLSAWALKNRPGEGKRVITPGEIQSQTASAYQGMSRSFGCEDAAITPFCDADCGIRRHV